MKNPIFTGAAVAIITPMNEDGTVNYDEFAKFIDFQIENGTDARQLELTNLAFKIKTT